MTDYYLIAITGDAAWPVGLHARTLDEAKGALSWQRQGGFDGAYHICTYDANRRDFVCIDCARPFVLMNEGYTQEAWARFTSSLPTQPMTTS